MSINMIRGTTYFACTGLAYYMFENWNNRSFDEHDHRPEPDHGIFSRQRRILIMANIVIVSYGWIYYISDKCDKYITSVR